MAWLAAGALKPSRRIIRKKKLIAVFSAEGNIIEMVLVHADTPGRRRRRSLVR